MPFWPGGFDWDPSKTLSQMINESDLLEELNFRKGILTVSSFRAFL